MCTLDPEPDLHHVKSSYGLTSALRPLQWRDARRTALLGADPGYRARRPRERGRRRRRAAAGAEQLREPRLPGLARSGIYAGLTGVGRREVLSPRALDRRANPRGARVLARARR